MSYNNVPVKTTFPQTSDSFPVLGGAASGNSEGAAAAINTAAPEIV